MPLDPPPRDGNNEVTPHDHGGIDAADGVIRRLSAFHWVEDPKRGGKTLSTMAFRASSRGNGGMSVDLQRLIEEAGLDAKEFVKRHPWIGAVRFAAGTLRGKGLIVGFDPLVDNPYHGEVWGNFSRTIQMSLRDIAEPFVAIPDAAEQGET